MRPLTPEHVHSSSQTGSSTGTDACPGWGRRAHVRPEPCAERETPKLRGVDLGGGLGGGYMGHKLVRTHQSHRGKCIWCMQRA